MRLLIFILLLFTLAGNSQVYINSYAITTIIPDTLPLSAEGGQVGFGLRDLKTGYSGAYVNVRRSSDNATQDIGDDGTGKFDVSAFSSFVGAGNGFVVTWYDQGTNSYNATQATNANQPQITLSAQNGHPVLTFDGTDYLTIPTSEANFIYMHNTGGTVLVAAKAGIVSDPNTIYAFTGNLAGTSTKTGFNLYFDDRAGSSRNNGLYGFVGKSVSGQPPVDRNENNVFTPNAFSLLYSIYDPDNATAGNRLDHFVNNGAVTVSNSNSFTPVSTNSTHPLQIGANGNNGSIFVGTMSEVVFYNALHSTATRNAISLNVNNFYAIY